MKGKPTISGRAAMALAVLFVLPIAMNAPAGEKLTVIATLFPQYDFARRIAGDQAEVRLLLPPGAESHSYEPTPSAMKEIASADVFVYTGEYMEPWAKRMVDAAAVPGGVLVVDASRGVAPRPAADGHDHDGGDHHGEEDAHYHAFDPHIWLDPVLALVMVRNIADALAERDPANADAYRANAKALAEEIEKADRDFRETVAALPRRTLVFGERFAFGYFFARYGLEEEGAYKSCAPGAEPGLKATIAVVEYVRKNNVRYIYREETAQPRISTVIQRETGAGILAVDSMHTPAADTLRSGAGYVDILRRNMAAFARGLE